MSWDVRQSWGVSDAWCLWVWGVGVVRLVRLLVVVVVVVLAVVVLAVVVLAVVPVRLVEERLAVEGLVMGFLVLVVTAMSWISCCISCGAEGKR